MCNAANTDSRTGADFASSVIDPVQATAAGKAAHISATSLTAARLYLLCLEAKPPSGGWFSVADTARRLSLVLGVFYRLLLSQPLSLVYFAYGWNRLWYGRFASIFLTLWLPWLPLLLCAIEVVKRVNEKMPWAEEDWKLKGPGRVFFVFCGSFLQYRTDRDGLEHTWYDAICTKEYWLGLLDQVHARRPLQLGRWDGERLHDVGPGIAFGRSDLVCKISDSYLGIGDRVFRRGVASGGDFDCLEDVQALLAADTEYARKSAVLCELVHPTSELSLASTGFSNVHSLDIVTIRTRSGVRVLTVLLWTDCTDWSSHSCQAGYVVDVHSETIVAPTAWYSPYFAKQASNLLGTRLPGVRDACAKAVAAHERSTLPWLTSVGWDAMITPEGVVFFEGNVAAYRTPRRMFLTPQLTAEFLRELRC